MSVVVERAFGAVALMVAAPACGSPAPTDGRSVAEIGTVPLVARSGKRLTLNDRITPGRPTLVSMWASWCLPCLVEAPWLDRMRKRYSRRYNFLYINRSEGIPDPMQPPAANQRFLARAGLADVDYVFADVKAFERIVGADMTSIPEGKVGIPRVYLFDAKGRQIYTAYGFSDAEGPALEKRLQQAMVR